MSVASRCFVTRVSTRFQRKTVIFNGRQLVPPPIFFVFLLNYFIFAFVKHHHDEIQNINYHRINDSLHGFGGDDFSGDYIITPEMYTIDCEM